MALTTRDPKEVQRRIVGCLEKSGTATLDRRSIFDQLPDLSTSDIERSIEALERAHKVIRFTDRGSVWIAESKLAIQRSAKYRRTRGSFTPELIYEHPHPIGDYEVAVLGVDREEGTWAGWLQFRNVKTNEKLRTEQETSQPDRDALEYWATGLEDLYFEGALDRAEPCPQ